MTKKENCAFPVLIDDVSTKQFCESGMNMREYFAIRAPIKELIGMYQDRPCATFEECASVAVMYADALIAELNKPTPQREGGEDGPSSDT